MMVVPGPGAHDLVNMNVFKKKAPSFGSVTEKKGRNTEEIFNQYKLGPGVYDPLKYNKLGT